MSGKNIAIVAGEASGDLQGAFLVREMHRSRPDLHFWGIGGPRMRDAGVELLYDCSGLSAIGLPEVLARIPRMTSVLLHMRREVSRRRPALFIPIDFGVFNLRLAAHAKKAGVPVFAYFPPGSWARDSRRAVRITSVATRIATPFPLSEQLLREAGADVTFIGHPLLDVVSPYQRKRRDSAPQEHPLIAFLPGSRPTEIKHILPAMVGAMQLLAAQMPKARIGIGLAPTIPESLLQDVLPDSPAEAVIERDSHDLLARASVAVLKSGSVTLEAAILGVPMVVVYAGSRFAHWYYRKFYIDHVPPVAIPNLIAGKEVVPELIQHDMQPERIAKEVMSLLRDDSRRETMVAALREITASLGSPGAVARAADLALELV